MPKVNMLENFAAKIWAKYSDDTGKALIHMGAIGWFLSAAAQLGMIATNKDIDKKEKRFLIPQEIADGVINVGLYYSICQGIKYIGEKLVEKGFLITQTTHNTVLDINRKDTNSVKNYVEGLLDEFVKYDVLEKRSGNNISDFYNCAIKCLKDPNKYLFDKKSPKLTFLSSKLKKAFKKYNTTELRAQEIDVLQKAFQNFKKFKNGVGVITSVGASILACNLITPIARNVTANYYQKKLMKKHPEIMQKQETTLPQQQYMPSVTSPAFNMFKI